MFAFCHVRCTCWMFVRSLPMWASCLPVFICLESYLMVGTIHINHVLILNATKKISAPPWTYSMGFNGFQKMNVRMKGTNPQILGLKVVLLIFDNYNILKTLCPYVACTLIYLIDGKNILVLVDVWSIGAIENKNHPKRSIYCPKEIWKAVYVCPLTKDFFRCHLKLIILMHVCAYRWLSSIIECTPSYGDDGEKYCPLCARRQYEICSKLCFCIYLEIEFNNSALEEGLRKKGWIRRNRPRQ